ncbi:Zinc finger CCCH domain-containing protein 3 [Aphanomyces cochlioides]|nr:Zinc finger CCCH domain-containing protein 3 [Aphanomyces cochlioides]
MVGCLRADLVAAAVRGVDAVAAYIDDHLGFLQEFLSLVVDSHDLPVRVKRVLWSAVLLRADSFASIDPAYISHTLTLLSAIEVDRYVNHLARLAFQRPPPDLPLLPSTDGCVVMPLHLSSLHKRKPEPAAGTPQESKKRMKKDKETPTALSLDSMDVMDYLEKKMGSERVAIKEQDLQEPPPEEQAEAAPLVLPEPFQTQATALANDVVKLKSQPSSCRGNLQLADDIFSLCANLVDLATCDTELLALLCSTLQLSQLPDDVALAFVEKLLEAKWVVRYTAVCLDASLFSRVHAVTAAVSRLVLKALQAVCNDMPVFAIERLVVPVLAADAANPPQCEAMTRIIRDGLGAQHMLPLVDQLTSAHVLRTTNDRVLLVVQQIFNAKATLTQATIDRVVSELEQAVATAPSSSVKFASIVFTIVTKYEALCVSHRDRLAAIAARCTSSMGKTAARAIDKLAR